MQIDGPLRISIVNNDDNQSRELQLNFTDAFQQQSAEQRIASFREYLQRLQQDLQQSQNEAEQQGMLTVLQIGEQLLPHIEQDEIELSETISIEIAPASPLEQLLSGATLK
jgi:hypothetical protein